jgi:hypothetical protein
MSEVGAQRHGGAATQQAADCGTATGRADCSRARGRPFRIRVFRNPAAPCVHTSQEGSNGAVLSLVQVGGAMQRCDPPVGDCCSCWPALGRLGQRHTARRWLRRALPMAPLTKWHDRARQSGTLGPGDLQPSDLAGWTPSWPRWHVGGRGGGGGGGGRGGGAGAASGWQ